MNVLRDLKEDKLRCESIISKWKPIAPPDVEKLHAIAIHSIDRAIKAEKRTDELESAIQSAIEDIAHGGDATFQILVDVIVENP